MKKENNNTNNEWKYDYGFISSGKYLDAFLEPLLSLLPEDQRRRILIVGPRPTSKLERFKQLGVTVSKVGSSWYDELKDAKCIIPLVTPGGVGNVLAALRRVQFDLSKTDQHLISFSSGASVATIRQYCQLPYNRIAIATGNSNIRLGLGCISYFANNQDLAELVEESLRVFGALTRENTEKDILLAITTWGTDNALNALALWLAWLEASNTDGLDFISWLKQLQDGFNEATYTVPLVTSDHSHNEGYEKISEYLNAKVDAFTGLGYLLPNAMDRVYVSFKSTLDTLIALEVNSEEGVKKHIKGVATEGGNTEKGLAKVTSIEDLSMPERCGDIVNTVYTFSQSFEKSALESIPDAVTLDNSINERWTEPSR